MVLTYESISSARLLGKRILIEEGFSISLATSLPPFTSVVYSGVGMLILKTAKATVSATQSSQCFKQSSHRKDASISRSITSTTLADAAFKRF